MTAKRPAKYPRIPRAYEAMPAATAVNRALEHYGLTAEIRAGRLITEWTELVGPKIAQRTRPDGIHERTLWIEVATSAWMHELNLLRAQLVQGLLDRLGEPRLFDDVKFRLAGRSRREPVALRAPRRPPAAAKPLPPPATGGAREAIVSEVSRVEDDDLRELIARIRITHDR